MADFRGFLLNILQKQSRWVGRYILCIHVARHTSVCAPVDTHVEVRIGQQADSSFTSHLSLICFCLGLPSLPSPSLLTPPHFLPFPLLPFPLLPFPLPSSFYPSPPSSPLPFVPRFSSFLPPFLPFPSLPSSFSPSLFSSPLPSPFLLFSPSLPSSPLPSFSFKSRSY